MAMTCWTLFLNPHYIIFCCLTCGLCVTCELSFMCSFTLEKSLAPRVLACKHIKGHFVHHCCHCLNIFSFIYSLFHHMLFLLAMGLHLLQVRIVEWWLFRKVTKHSVLWKQILLSLNPISWLHVCRIAWQKVGGRTKLALIIWFFPEKWVQCCTLNIMNNDLKAALFV